ncbi:heme-degrading domain-containing protein [Pantoea cypripedii]|uniref:Uncharacterized protein n=1 Tax=Pantoea cypripedii TaxID=55209 RepID=A0A6B9GAT9_PANCY|nr:heme-degrading domain-containing protein [Pantoea cypripedii]QGY32953.1 hypothetical protein CUN67_28900 [Pantoea cypripedii]
MNEISESKRVKEQEEKLTFRSFDGNAAWGIGNYLREAAQSRNVDIAVEIFINGMVIFLMAMDKTAPDNSEWMRRKRNFVLRTRMCSYAGQLIRESAERGSNVLDGMSPEDFAANGGSFPIVVTGVGIIGTVTVSGLSSRDDHYLVTEAIEYYLQNVAGDK